MKGIFDLKKFSDKQLRQPWKQSSLRVKDPTEFYQL